MSIADAPRGPVEIARPNPPAPTDFFRQFARFLYTQNPFYLLSVAFVLHSTRLWYRQGAGPFDPWPLMGIIGGYILLVAAAGFFLIRLGKVWDDARSIFLILLLLFVELSLTFDGVLVGQPATGRALLVTGLVLAAAISEGLLLGLRIRLPVLYRVPYHLFLALLFLYPLAIVTGLGSETRLAVWRIYLFSPATAAVLVTLLPAIRRGPQYVSNTGTPWRWPWFPWSLFGFLTICACLRAYALSLSFDTVLMQKLDEAMRLDSAFGLYFLVPMLLAIALLLLEAGIVGRNRLLQCLALCIPAVCLLLSLPAQSGSAPYFDFLSRFVGRVGSPLWVASMAAIVFFAYARVRQVRFAGELFWSALFVASCISRTTVDLNGLVAPQTWALWFAAVVQGVIGICNRQSSRLFIATTCLLAAVRSDFLSGADSMYRDGLPLHLAGVAVLSLGILFDDPFVHWLRRAGAPLLVTAAVIAAGWPAAWPISLPEWSALVYVAAIVVTTFGYAYCVGSQTYFFAGLANLCLFIGRLLYELTGVLKRLLDWEGATWFVWGLVWFVVGILISAAKAGLTGRLWRIMPHLRRTAAAPPKT